MVLINEKLKELGFKVILDIVAQVMSILVEASFPKHLWFIRFWEEGTLTLSPYVGHEEGGNYDQLTNRPESSESSLWSSHAVHCI